MSSPKERIQITLPKEILEKIDKQIVESFSTRSKWFLKVALAELQRKEREGKPKKVIELDI